MIDIENFSEAELLELNDRIVDRLEFLHQQKTTAALQKLTIGSRVMFTGPDDMLVRGIVVRRNRKTVIVHAQDNRQWKVSPSLLRPDQDIMDERAASSAGRVVPFARSNS